MAPTRLDFGMAVVFVMAFVISAAIGVELILRGLLVGWLAVAILPVVLFLAVVPLLDATHQRNPPFSLVSRLANLRRSTRRKNR